MLFNNWQENFRAENKTHQNIKVNERNKMQQTVYSKG